MVINGIWAGRSLTLSVKPNCLTISLSAGGQTRVFSFDFEGRLWTALLEGVSYRRGLDGKMVAKWQETHGGEAGRQRRWIHPPEALRIETEARQASLELYRAIQAGEAALDGPLTDLGQAAFERIRGYDEARRAADIARYHQIYRPVGILPPDQYMAVVLQATEGCAFNTCTFCDFYKDRPFRIKNEAAFLEHATAVRDFLGAGLSLRRTVFLGDANALVVPMPRLLPLIQGVHQVYDVEGLGGIYAFLDGFSGEKKSPRDYRLLAEMGLKRVYLGLESGSEDLLKFLRKPGKPKDAVKAVQAMKAGGVAVGVIVLLGAGGHTYAGEHVRETIAALNAMRLDADDIIYFSELITAEDMRYVQDAYQTQLRPLSPEERLAQGEAIEAGLRFSRRGGVPHISRYDIREFVY